MQNVLQYQYMIPQLQQAHSIFNISTSALVLFCMKYDSTKFLAAHAYPSRLCFAQYDARRSPSYP